MSFSELEGFSCGGTYGIRERMPTGIASHNHMQYRVPTLSGQLPSSGFFKLVICVHEPRDARLDPTRLAPQISGAPLWIFFRQTGHLKNKFPSMEHATVDELAQSPAGQQIDRGRRCVCRASSVKHSRLENTSGTSLWRSAALDEPI